MQVKMPEVFVIAVIDADEVISYYYDGPDCIEFSKLLTSAELFIMQESAELIYKQLLAESLVVEVSNSGIKRPSTSIRRALGLSDNKTTSSATLAVIKLGGSIVTSAVISAEIKKPTGYTYD